MSKQDNIICSLITRVIIAGNSLTDTPIPSSNNNNKENKVIIIIIITW